MQKRIGVVGHWFTRGGASTDCYGMVHIGDNLPMHLASKNHSLGASFPNLRLITAPKTSRVYQLCNQYCNFFMDAGVASHGTVSAVNSRAATPAGYGFLSAAIHACPAKLASEATR